MNDYRKMRHTPEEMSEFKGQIMDTFEDFMDEHNLTLNNSERSEDGIDPSAAIIYGSQYDWLAEAADDAADACMHGEVLNKKYIDPILDAFEDLVKEHGTPEAYECAHKERLALKHSLWDLMQTWFVKTRTFCVTAFVTGIYSSAIQVPADLTWDEAMDYTADHLSDVPVTEIDFDVKSTELDEENCDFEDADEDKNKDMIVFLLTMPGVGSWNGKWTGEGRLYCRTMPEKSVPKELVGHSYEYAWDDGWRACVSVEKMPAAEARKMKQTSVGFCGYDWMIQSLLKRGYILSPSDERRMSK